MEVERALRGGRSAMQSSQDISESIVEEMSGRSAEVESRER